MGPDHTTRQFIAELDRFSGGRLRNRDDLAVLLSLSADPDLAPSFDRAAFLAKFSVKSRKIMNRIGKEGEGYDALAAELNKSLAEIADLLRKISLKAGPETRMRIEDRYLALTGSGMQNLFSLLEDLMWYKNWSIDHRRREL